MELKGGEGKSLNIDTESAFRPEGILSTTFKFGLAESEVLDNVAFARVYSDHQNYLLLLVASMLAETK